MRLGYKFPEGFPNVRPSSPNRALDGEEGKSTVPQLGNHGHGRDPNRPPHRVAEPPALACYNDAGWASRGLWRLHPPLRCSKLSYQPVGLPRKQPLVGIR